jgi:hippurate hydrolase
MAKSSSSPSTAALREEHGDPRGVIEQAEALFDDTVALRRDLHQWPELGNDLPRTREQVLHALDRLPLDITLHTTTSGFAALLTGDKPGPTMLLRGDMDALPMPEDTGVDFSSKVDNAMHACGHDTHTAMLVGAAKALSERKSDIAGRVLFMFQSGEEGHGGAELMLDEGLLDVPTHKSGGESPVTAAFAMHISSNLPNGAVAIKSGPIMASSDQLTITVKGRGGHGSSPHFALDPIPVACEIVQAIQTLVTRRIDVFDPGVITVTSIHSGTAYNVIPEHATILGTMRAMSEKTRTKIHEGLRRVAEGIASAHEMDIDIDLEHGYPVTVNDKDFSDFSVAIANTVLRDNHVIALPNPVMGEED